MSNITTNLKLNLPDTSVTNWNIPINSNFSIIDSLFSSSGILLPAFGGVTTNSVLHNNIGSGSATNGQVLTADGLGNSSWISLTAASIPGLVSALAIEEVTTHKAQPNGYASLDGTGNVPSAQLGNASLTIAVFGASGGSHSTGLVPDPGSSVGAVKFLREDVSWDIPIGFANPMTTLGDVIYENATPVAARLAGNTTTTKKFLTQTGNGSISAVPAWGTIVNADLPTSGVTANSYTAASITVNAQGIVTAASSNSLSGGLSNPMTTLGDLIYENATPTAARLAGNITTTTQYLSSTGNGTISATPAWAQPAASNLSNGTTGTGNIVLATSPSIISPTFTGSGSTGPLTAGSGVLGTANTWTAIQTFNSGDLKLAGASSGTTILNASATASGTVTIPSGTDTLVTLTASQSLSNKTLPSPVITGTVTGGASYSSPTITSATINSSLIGSPNIIGTVAGGANYSGITLSGFTSIPNSGYIDGSGNVYINGILYFNGGSGSLDISGNFYTNGSVTINNDLSVPNANVTAAGFIAANDIQAGTGGGGGGYINKQGIFGTFNSDVFNFFWDGTYVEVWIDNTYMGAISLISDARLKDQITPITSGLNLVNKLNPVSYVRREVPDDLYKTDNITHLGFIAQELQEVIPSAVVGEPDGVTSKGKIQPQTLQLIDIVAVLTKSVQELSAQVTTLQDQVKTLQAK